MNNEMFPEGLKNFIDTMNKKRSSDNLSQIQTHNLYLLQTVDREGNITGEAYGVNLMTNYGFKYFFRDGLNLDYCRIYIGNGTEIPDGTSKTLYSFITTQGSTDVSRTISGVGNTYDKDTGVYTGTQKIYEGYFDYNISGVTENQEITEIGFGGRNYYGDDGQDSLLTHAKIYDAEGNLSSITKRINERLFISMYWSASYNKKLIEDCWDKGIYVFIDPQWLISAKSADSFRPYLSFEPQFIRNDYNNSSRYLLGRYNLYNGNTTVVDDNTLRSRITTGSIMLENPYDYTSMLIFSGDYSGSYDVGNSFTLSGMFIITHDKLEEPEEMTSRGVYTNNYESLSLSGTMGKNFTSEYELYGKGKLPVSDFDIKHVRAYNHLTKQWDIDKEFISDPNAEYTNAFRIAGHVLTDFNGKRVSARVYVNTTNNLPIKSFNNSGITLYATDEYWDTSTWVLVNNLSSIDEELRTKKYFIKTSGSDVFLSPNKDTVGHSIVTQLHKTSFNTVPKNNISYSKVKPLSSDEYGWIMTADYLVYPNLNDGTCEYKSLVYDTVNKHHLHRTMRWSTGNKVVGLITEQSYDCVVSPYTVVLYDISEEREINTSIIELDFSSKSFSYHNYFSFSENGFLAAQRVDGGGNECVILDIYGDGETPIQHRITDCVSCHALGRSNNCVYNVPGQSVLTFNIYDMKNQTVIDTFTLPDEGYSLQGIMGWREFVYVRVSLSGSYSTFLYNTNTKTLVHLTNLNIPQCYISLEKSGIIQSYKNGSVPNNGLDILCVDECMIIGRTYGDNGTWLFKESDPENPFVLSSKIPGNNNWENNYKRDMLNNLANGQLKYVDGGRQLLMSNTRDYFCVHDIGNIIDNGLTAYLPFYRYLSDTLSNYDYGGSMGFFGNGVFIIKADGSLTWYPIEGFLELEISGTTKTIQSFNNPKRLQGKTYTWTITNDTSKWSEE